MKKLLIILLLFMVVTFSSQYISTFLLNNYGVKTKAEIYKYEFNHSASEFGRGSAYGNISYFFELNNKTYKNTKSITLNNIVIPLNNKSVIGQSIVVEYCSFLPNISRISHYR